VARQTNPSRVRTRLAWYRIYRGYKQEELAELTGIPLATLRKLERGALPNPGIRMIINCARVLNVSWEQLWEPAWNEWFPFNDAPEPTQEEVERQMLARADTWPEPSDAGLDQRLPFPTSNDDT
jgi:transcriptional regulator with XRE-family HTH domain